MTASTVVGRVVATWFGCGYWPWGPGTVGSAAALAIAYALSLPPWSFAVLAAAVLPVSIWASGTEAVTSGRKDPQHVVVDEVVGQWITLSAAATLDWKNGLAAFLLFRVFDILKPSPVRQFEALPGGLGIMADDVMAGIYGALVLLTLRWLT